MSKDIEMMFMRIRQRLKTLEIANRRFAVYARTPSSQTNCKISFDALESIEKDLKTLEEELNGK